MLGIGLGLMNTCVLSTVMTGETGDDLTPFTESFSTQGNLENLPGWSLLSGTAGAGVANASGNLKANDSSSTGSVYLSQMLAADTQDQYVQAVVKNSTTSTSASGAPFICCRLLDINNWVGARYVVGTGAYQIYQRVNGTLTQLGQYSTTPAIGDLIRLEVEGTEARLFVNGTKRVTGTITGGVVSNRQGVVLRSAVVDNWIDSYEAGPYAAALTISASDKQTYKGGFIEIQSDSYDGNNFVDMDSVTKLWAFPSSLTTSEQARAKTLLGNKIMFIRFPLGFGYRGARNVDGTTGLAKNWKDRLAGAVNSAIAALLADVIPLGGGLAPSYWSPPPYWKTTGAGGSVANGTLWAGAAYSRGTSLDSIRSSDATQYAAQIDAFTNAVIDDLEYLHTHVAPVRMFGLQNEPTISAGYGSCTYTNQLYTDVLKVLVPKIRNSSTLSTYGGQTNNILIHTNSWDCLASIGLAIISDATVLSTGKTLLQEIGLCTYHQIDNIAASAEYISTHKATLTAAGKPTNLDEQEYFSPNSFTDDFRFANSCLQMALNLTETGGLFMMPIIHMFKPLGQTDSSSNTLGYGLFKARLPAPFGEDPSTPGDSDPTIGYGQFAPVDPNWNAACLMLSVPPGSIIRDVTSPNARAAGTGRLAFVTPTGKTGLILVNRTAASARFTLDAGSKVMSGTRYSAASNGASRGTKTSVMKMTVPAYSGEIWLEQ